MANECGHNETFGYLSVEGNTLEVQCQDGEVYARVSGHGYVGPVMRFNPEASQGLYAQLREEFGEGDGG